MSSNAVEYAYLNVGVEETLSDQPSEYAYLNVGVEHTPYEGGVDYVYLGDVIEPPSEFWVSDGLDWFKVVLDYELENALDQAETNSQLFAGKLVSDQGLPAGGSAGQVLKKLSPDNYDVTWAADTGGGSGGLPLGGTPGQILIKGSNLDGDASWQPIPKELPLGGTTGQTLVKKSDTNGDVEWKTLSSGGGAGSSTDRRWSPEDGAISVDEFDGASLDPKWLKLDYAGGEARAAWKQGGGVLSVYNSGGDPAAQMHSLVTAQALAIGDYFETCMRFMTSGDGYPMCGLIVQGSSGISGNQVQASMWHDPSNGMQASIRRGSNYVNPITPDGTGIGGWTANKVMSLYGGIAYTRLFRSATDTYEMHMSPDGVSWIKMTTTTQSVGTPSHIGLFCTSWGSAKPFIASFEYLRMGTLT